MLAYTKIIDINRQKMQWNVFLSNVKKNSFTNNEILIFTVNRSYQLKKQ